MIRIRITDSGREPIISFMGIYGQGKIYTIKEISEYSGWNASTLRYYEAIGLLPDVEHQNNKRIYTDWHIRRIDGIQCFKKTNMSIQEILQFFQLEETNVEGNIDTLVEILENHKKLVEKQIAELEANLKHVNHKYRHYSTIKSAIESGTEWPVWENE